MAKQKMQVGLDVSELKTAAGDFQRALKANSNSVDDFVVSMAKFNDKGKLINATIKSVTTEGQVLDQVLKRGAQGWKVHSTIVHQSADALDRFAESQRKALEAMRLAQAQAVATPLLASFNNQNVASASTAKQAQLAGAQNALVKSLMETQLPQADVQRIFDRIKQGFIDVESAAGQKVQKALLDVKKAFEGIDEAADKALKKSQAKLDKDAKDAKKKADDLKKAADEAARLANVPIAESELRRSFPAPSNATIQQINRYEAAIQAILKMIASGKISMRDFLNLVGQIQLDPKASIPGLSGDQNAVRAALTKITQAFNEAGASGANAGKSILISWQGIVRLMETVVIRRFVGFLLQDLVNIQNESYKFSENISRIAALNQNASQTAAQWASTMRSLADANQLSVGEVTQAAFESLGSRLKDTATSTILLGEAFRFARVAGIDAKKAIELIDTAMQAYNLTTTQSAQVTAAFYATQSVGKISMEQLHLGYGRVAEIAASLGINLNEVLGIVASFTNAGIRSADAFNLLFAILQKLQHPTQEMEQFLRSLGVATGEMAIRTYGLTGLFQRLQEEINRGGGHNRLIELERDIRAVRGATALFSSEVLGQLPNVINQIENGAERYQRAQRIFNENPRMQLASELQKISNYFQTDFGEQFAASLAKINNTVGGFSNLVKKIGEAAIVFSTALTTVVDITAKFGSLLAGVLPNIQTLTTLIMAGVVAWGIYKVTVLAVAGAQAIETATGITSIGVLLAKTAALGGNTLSALTNIGALKARTLALWSMITADTASAVSLRVTAGAFVAAGLAAIAAYLAMKRAQAEAEGAVKANKFLGSPERIAEENQERLNRQIEERRTREVEEFRKFYDDKLRIVLQYTARVNAALNEQLNQALAADHHLLGGLQNQAQGMGQNLEQRIRHLRDLQNDVEKILREQSTRIRNLQISGEQHAFERSLNLPGQPLSLNANPAVPFRAPRALSLQNEQDRAAVAQFLHIGNDPTVPSFQLAQMMQQANMDGGQQWVQFWNRGLEQLNAQREAEARRLQGAMGPTPSNQLQTVVQADALRGMVQPFGMLNASLVQLAQNFQEVGRQAFSARTAIEQHRLVLERVQQLQAQAVLSAGLAGNFEEARKKLEEANTLLEKFFEKQRAANEEALRFIRNLQASTDRRNFEYSISDQTLPRQIQMTLERVQRLRQEGEQLFRADMLEDARKKFEEIDHLLDRIYMNQRRANEESRRFLRNLDANSDRRQFERSLSGSTPWEETQLTIERVERLRREAVDLFHNDQLEDSRKKFEEIDKLLEKIFERQRSWDERARRLGVAIPTGPSEADQMMTDAENLQRSLERGRLAAGTAREGELRRMLDQATQQHLRLEEQRRVEGLGRALELDRQITLNRQMQLAFERELVAQQREKLRIAQLTEQTLQQQFRSAEQIRNDIQQLTQTQAQQQERRATGLRQVGERREVVGGAADTIITEIRRVINPQTAWWNNVNMTVLNQFETAASAFRANPTRLNMQELLRQFLPVEAEFGNLRSGNQPLRFANNMTFEENFARFRDQLLALGQSMNLVTDADARLAELAAERRRLDQEIPGEQMQQAIQQQQSFQVQIRNLTTEIITSFQAIRDSTRRLQEQLGQPPGAGGGQPRAMGGFMRSKYFAQGGPVGTDTIPAWLSPGEYVMDAANTSKFFPQLVSMSMGLGHFGPHDNNNVNVGDINITYQATDSVQTDVRRLGEQLRREIRRRNLRLD